MPSPTLCPHPIALGSHTLAPAGLWDPLGNTAASPHSPGGHTLALLASPHLHPSPSPSLRAPPPSRNSPGWAFLSLVPRQCSWCCGLGRGWRTRQKARGRELSLSSNGRHGSLAPPSNITLPPKSHTGVSANKTFFFFFGFLLALDTHLSGCTRTVPGHCQHQRTSEPGWWFLAWNPRCARIFLPLWA